MIDANRDLGANRFLLLLEKRQEGVGGTGGDDFEMASPLQRGKRTDEISSIPLVKGSPKAQKAIAVETGNAVECGVPTSADRFLFRKLTRSIEALGVTPDEQLVLKHGNQGRRERHREANWDAFLRQPIEYFEQREVSLGDRLVQPVLFEEVLVLGVPHEWQVGVENDRKIAPHQGYGRPEGENSQPRRSELASCARSNASGRSFAESSRARSASSVRSRTPFAGRSARRRPRSASHGTFMNRASACEYVGPGNCSTCTSESPSKIRSTAPGDFSPPAASSRIVFGQSQNTNSVSGSRARACTRSSPSPAARSSGPAPLRFSAASRADASVK